MINLDKGISEFLQGDIQMLLKEMNLRAMKLMTNHLAELHYLKGAETFERHFVPFLEQLSERLAAQPELVIGVLSRLGGRLLSRLFKVDETDVIIHFVRMLGTTGELQDQVFKFQVAVLSEVWRNESCHNPLERPSLVEQVEYYLAACPLEYLATLQVKDIAYRFCVSQSSLYKYMKEKAGISPGRLLRMTRLNRAFELLFLSETKMTIEQVARSVGFAKVDHFRVCFRKQFCVNPSAIANNSRI